MGELDPAVRMTEPVLVPDIFVSGLGEVEDLGGGCFRFVFYVKQHTPDGTDETMIVAKLIAPMEAVPPALLLAARAIGLSLNSSFLPRRDVN